MQGVAGGGSPLVRQMLSEASFTHTHTHKLDKQEFRIPDRFNLYLSVVVDQRCSSTYGASSD